MEIIATRDSVAMGDDVDAPHERCFSFTVAVPIEQAIEEIVSSGYLASVQGGATWSAVSGVPISVVARRWNQPRPVSWAPVDLSSLQVKNGAICVHFNYHTQIDPEIVLEVLKRLKLNVL
jgi:hypothetical protein